jgi:arabinoxylan arabinofuranohydrolase
MHDTSRDSVTKCRTRNPVLPVDQHIPDGEAHVMSDGRLYVYGSFDSLDTWYCSDRYFVASTDDLCDWRVDGPSFRGQDVPWFPDARGYAASLPDEARASGVDDGGLVPAEYEHMPLLYAPDVAERDGEYFLYFCMSDGSEGVARSASPTGPFTDAHQLPATGIDPAVFVDDDGSAYYYWGQLRAHGVKLNPDMVSFDPEGVIDDLATEEVHGFHEGSSMRKIGSTYYFVFADGSRGTATCLGYATSTHPLGPFTYRGVIVDNTGCDPGTLNNHGSIEQFDGRWYVFYHRSSRGSRYHRRLCVEPITILADGTIPEVPMTSQGAGEPFGAGEYVEAYRACELSGTIRIDVREDGGEALVGAASGDTATFRYVHSASGFTGLRLEADGAGRIEIQLGDEVVGTAVFEPGVPPDTVPFDDRRRSVQEALTLRIVESRDLTVHGWVLVGD